MIGSLLRYNIFSKFTNKPVVHNKIIFFQIRVTGTTAHHFQIKTINDWEKRCEGLLFSTFRGNATTKYGKEHEDPALKLFAAMYPGKETETQVGFCINVNAPMFGYSPDGIHDGQILLEVKCPILGKTLHGAALCDKLPYVTKVGDIFTLKRTHTYYTQVQFGLAILNLKMCKFIIYSNVKGDGNIHVIDVPRNEGFCASLIRILSSRYTEYILPFLVKNKDKLLLSKNM